MYDALQFLCAPRFGLLYFAQDALDAQYLRKLGLSFFNAQYIRKILSPNATYLPNAQNCTCFPNAQYLPKSAIFAKDCIYLPNAQYMRKIVLLFPSAQYMRKIVLLFPSALGPLTIYAQNIIIQQVIKFSIILVLIFLYIQ